MKCECLFIEITKDNSKIIVGGIYRHPNQNIDLFTNSLQTILSKISSSKCSCILAADMNINLLKADTNAATGNYLNNLLLYNFRPMILFPTRISHKSAKLIDHIYYYEGCHSKKTLN